MHFQYCMIFVLGGLSPLLKHLKGALAPLAPPVPPPLLGAHSHWVAKLSILEIFCAAVGYIHSVITVQTVKG